MPAAREEKEVGEDDREEGSREETGTALNEEERRNFGALVEPGRVLGWVRSGPGFGPSRDGPTQ